MKNILYASAVLLFSLQVSADESPYHSSLTAKPELSGFYIGLGAGPSQYWNAVIDDDDDSISYTSDLESKNTAVKLYSGVNINRIVGVEVSYSDYGSLTPKPGSSAAGSLSPRAVAVAANIGYTFDTGLRAFGIAGLSVIDLRQSEVMFNDDKRVAFRYGFGGEYQPSTATGLTFRLAFEADMYAATLSNDYNNRDNSSYISQIGTLYLGAMYKF
ncbi:outer membrane beta-barrel protein [Psychromonas aquimarina]|uniref:outer membrane beta-barrel protein n=1 Tax=Psychromonas aquimarina TaxID=444919 RepID=UPI00041C2637|nr:outer membrane beta-barrel protein [Psychromonas aquimarina]